VNNCGGQSDAGFGVQRPLLIVPRAGIGSGAGLN
jgi:hypothetical protein